MEGWRAQEDQRDYQPLRRGWFLGLAEEKERLLELIAEQKSPAHYSEELRESDAHRAERFLREELRRRGCTEKQLHSSAKGDPVKVEIAQLLRPHTTMTIRWTAERLYMGTPEHVAHLLYWARRRQKPPRRH